MPRPSVPSRRTSTWIAMRQPTQTELAASQASETQKIAEFRG